MTSHPTDHQATGPKLGFFTRLLEDAPAAQRYRFALEQIETAEDFGFHSAWVAQHHFSATEGGLPSPLVFLSHAAARTRRIRLGTAIITLPMENAVRVAEDAAVLDELSVGRLEIGLGSGGNPKSFPAFGTSFEERRETFADNLATLRTLFAGGPLPTAHRLYPASSADRANLDRRLWQATFSSGGAGAAGAAGDGLMLSRTQPRPQDDPGARLDEVQLPVIDTYLSQLPDGVEPRILASRTAVVADAADLPRLREITEPALRAEADRLVGYDTSGLQPRRAPRGHRHLPRHARAGERTAPTVTAFSTGPRTSVSRCIRCRRRMRPLCDRSNCSPPRWPPPWDSP